MNIETKDAGRLHSFQSCFSERADVRGKNGLLQGPWTVTRGEPKSPFRSSIAAFAGFV